MAFSLTAVNNIVVSNVTINRAETGLIISKSADNISIDSFIMNNSNLN
jgi:hypothetical protein